MSDTSSRSRSRTRSRSRSRSPLRQRRGRFPGAVPRAASPVVEMIQVVQAEVHVQPVPADAVVEEVLVDEPTRQMFAIQQAQQTMLLQLQAQ